MADFVHADGGLTKRDGSLDDRGRMVEKTIPERDGAKRRARRHRPSPSEGLSPVFGFWSYAALAISLRYAADVLQPRFSCNLRVLPISIARFTAE